MLAKTDREYVFTALKPILGVKQWSASQVAGLTRLLDNMEKDILIPEGRVGVQRASYFIFTSWHETGHAWMPVKERGGANYFIKMYGPNTRRGQNLGNDSTEEAIDYSGKGDVQLTGENNYEAAEDMLRRNYPEMVVTWEARTGKKFDLTVGDQPNDKDDVLNALVPEFSYAIMVAGVTEGLFGPPIAKFINKAVCDYYNARRCVNVLDHAEYWSEHCPKIEKVLSQAIAKATVAEIPTPPPAPVVEPVAAPAVPVDGGGKDDPATQVTEKWTAKIATISTATGITGLGLLDFLKSASFELLRWAIPSIAAVVIVYLIIHAVGNWQKRQISSDPTKINVT